MKDLYNEPFLNSWPTPLSFHDIKECFRKVKPFKKGVYIKVNYDRKIYFQKDNKYNPNPIKAFWNVFFSPVSF